MKESELELQKRCKPPLLACPTVPAVAYVDSQNCFYLKEMVHCLNSLKSMGLNNFLKYSL